MRFYRVFYSFVLLHWIFISGTVECVCKHHDRLMRVISDVRFNGDNSYCKTRQFKMLQLFTYYTLPHVVHDVSDEKD